MDLENDVLESVIIGWYLMLMEIKSSFLKLATARIFTNR